MLLMWLISDLGYLLSNNFIVLKCQLFCYILMSFHAIRLWLFCAHPYILICSVDIEKCTYSTYSLYAVLDSSIVDWFYNGVFWYPIWAVCDVLPFPPISLSLFTSLYVHIYKLPCVWKCKHTVWIAFLLLIFFCDVNVSSVVESLPKLVSQEILRLYGTRTAHVAFLSVLTKNNMLVYTRW